MDSIGEGYKDPHLREGWHCGVKGHQVGLEEDLRSQESLVAQIHAELRCWHAAARVGVLLDVSAGLCVVVLSELYRAL